MPVLSCPTCKSRQPAGLGSCPQCGSALILTCPGCHAELASGSRFCNLCGARLEPAAGPSCPGCHAELEPGSRFCNFCGHGLEIALPTQPASPHLPCVQAHAGTDQEPDDRQASFVQVAEGQQTCANAAPESNVEQPTPHGAGVQCECPHCELHWYTEDLGQFVECRECNGRFFISEEGAIPGRVVECPHCEISFYSEEFGRAVTCGECTGLFTFDGKGEPLGKQVSCPHCEIGFYSEDLDQKVKCPECSEPFTPVEK